jgi:hypothetical protein
VNGKRKHKSKLAKLAKLSSKLNVKKRFNSKSKLTKLAKRSSKLNVKRFNSKSKLVKPFS